MTCGAGIRNSAHSPADRKCGFGYEPRSLAVYEDVMERVLSGR